LPFGDALRAHGENVASSRPEDELARTA